MKYKLLKDLPTFKAGDLFELDDSGLWLLNKDEFKTVHAYANSTIRRFPNILKDWFEPVIEDARWRADEDGDYYYIDSNGNIFSEGDAGHWCDTLKYKLGNYFKTREEAEQAREFFKAWRTLKDDTKGFTFNSSNCGFSVLCTDEHHLKVEYSSAFREPILFRTPEDAKASIKAHRKEWLTFYGVEEEE